MLCISVPQESRKYLRLPLSSALPYTYRQCWNVGSPCGGGNETKAGPGETVCSDIGAGKVHWCCNSQFSNCTQRRWEQDNCKSWFDNPNRIYNPLAASSMASRVKQVALTQPTVTNIIVSTSSTGGWTEITATSSSSPITSIGITATAPTTSFSIGAIVGIVAGAVGITLVAAVIAFICWSQRKRGGSNQESKSSVQEKDSSQIHEISSSQKVVHEKSASPVQDLHSATSPSSTPDAELKTMEFELSGLPRGVVQESDSEVEGTPAESLRSARASSTGTTLISSPLSPIPQTPIRFYRTAAFPGEARKG